MAAFGGAGTDRAFKLTIMISVVVIALAAVTAVVVFALRPPASTEAAADLTSERPATSQAPSNPYKGDDGHFLSKVQAYFPDDDGPNTGGVHAMTAAQTFCSTTMSAGASAAVRELSRDANLTGGDTAVRDTAYWAMQVYCPQFADEVSVALP